jgi:uncharacterized cupin superfamily protein
MNRNFYHASTVEPVEIRPNPFGTVIAGAQGAAVRWEFPAGNPRTGIHWHDEHEQFGVVLAGSISLRIGNDVQRLETGDIYYVPRGVYDGETEVHGDVKAVVLDFFIPPRLDYVAAADGGPPVDVSGSA